jgi:drug/metabolite transporter (DMT)-like permease
MPRWLFWMVVTLASWGIWAILLHEKLNAQKISGMHSQAMSTLGIVPIVLALWWMNEPAPAPNKRRGVLLAFGSGVVSALGNIAYYAALSNAEAATVVPLAALYPAITILLAVPLLKERVAPLQWVGMALSLGAMYLFLQPERRVVSPWLWLALLPIVLYGVTLLMQKMATDDISARSSAIWFLLAFVPVAVLIVLYNPLPEGITGRTWALQLAVGFTLAFGNLTILLACASGGKASIVAPISGLYPMISIPIAVLALGDQVTARQAAGIMLALAAVFLLSYQPEAKASGAANLNLE